MPDKQTHSRILFVDDEPAIRLTLPSILQMHNFEVTTAGTVPEALDAITKQQFDVLLADLNIGQPGDGFTVVSAMRRTQPDAVTIIITGYPAFETALEAIRNQVDDYVVKPADIPGLMQVIERHLKGPRHQPITPMKRMCTLLNEQRDTIVADWIEAVKSDPELQRVAVPDEDRREHILSLLNELIRSLQKHPGKLSEKAAAEAARHGRTRRQQGYTLTQMLKESRHLRRIIGITVQQHLLAVDISNLMTDMIEAAESFDLSVGISVEGFLAEDKQAA